MTEEMKAALKNIERKLLLHWSDLDGRIVDLMNSCAVTGLYATTSDTVMTGMDLTHFRQCAEYLYTECTQMVSANFRAWFI